MHRQYFDWAAMTLRTICTAELDGTVAASRAGGSPIRVFVTAKADLEIERKL